MRPQQLVDAANAVLEKSATSVAMFGVVRHERDGMVDDEMRRRIRLLAPHFRRAVLIGKVIELKKAEAASLADTLDGISAGMFLIDATGRLVHANVAGHVMLNAANVLHVKAGRLAVTDPQADHALADTLRPPATAIRRSASRVCPYRLLDVAESARSPICCH